MLFSVWGLNYNEACALIEDAQSYGIEANITPGGIAMYPDGTIQVDKMNLVCAWHHTIASRGHTLHEDIVMFRRGD